jgi:hypothetical protein
MQPISNILILVLQCGSFLLFPSLTFGMGLWFINRRLQANKTLATLAGAGLWGVTAFEISLLGMLFDPQTNYPFDWGNLLTISVLIGVGTFAFVLVVLPMLSQISSRH